jgi:hypothetical protein
MKYNVALHSFYMPVSVLQTAWRMDLESYHRVDPASRPVPQKFQGHSVSPPCRGEAVPLCSGSHVRTASGPTERNGSQFVCCKQPNQLNVTVLLTVRIPVCNMPTPTTPQQLLSKYIPKSNGFCTASLHFNSTQKYPTPKCHTLTITTTQIPLQIKQYPVHSSTGWDNQLVLLSSPLFTPAS